MTTRVMVTVNGTSYEAHLVPERRNEHGQFVRDDHVLKVRGHEDSQGFGEMWVGDNMRVIVTEHQIRKEGDLPTS